MLAKVNQGKEFELSRHDGILTYREQSACHAGEQDVLLSLLLLQLSDVELIL